MKYIKTINATLIATSIVTYPIHSFALESEVKEADTIENVEKIVVTARKRSERLIDVPEQITAFGEADILNTGIDSVEDVTQLMPNLSIVDTQNPGTVFINIRGIGQYRNSEPPVAIVIDGVQLTSSDAITQELYDIQQIGVLKGPQGALFGRNAVGGAINITTKAPSDNWENSITAGFANGDEFSSKLSISGPLKDESVYIRASAAATEFGGVIENEFLDVMADRYSDRNARLRLRFYPTDDLQADFRASYSDLNSGSSYFATNIGDDGFTRDGDANTIFPVTTNTDGSSSRRLSEIALKVDYDMDSYSLTSITASSKTTESFFQDLDFTLAPILDFGQFREVETISQELRLSYDDGESFDGLLGFYVLDSKRQIDTDVFGSLTNIGPANDPNFIAGNVSIYDFDLNAPVDTPFVSLSNLEDNFAWAVFVNTNFELTDEIDLSVGLRYDKDERKQIDLNTKEVLKRTFDLLQPKIQLSYKPDSSSNYYLSWGKGFRSGGFNQEDTVSDSFEAEEVTTSEIGIKTVLENNDIRINAALFHTDFNNRQDFTFIAGVQTILTIPDADIIGAELEIEADLTDEIQVSASGGILDTEIKSEVVGFNPSDAGLPANTSFIGNDIPLAYGWSYNLGAQYKSEINKGWLTARVDFSAKGDLAWELANQDRQDDLYLVNARVVYELENITIALWSKNLLDKAYHQEFVSREFSALPTDISFPAAGRRYGITFTSNF
jgi:iron complex outermembrane receptor protein